MEHNYCDYLFSRLPLLFFIRSPCSIATKENGTARNGRTGKRCRFTGEEDKDKNEKESKNRMREKRKEKLKEEAKEAEELLQAPLDVFGKDIMLKILKSLNERSMTLSLLVSRAWNSIACSDMLWTSKLYVLSFYFYS